MKFNSLHKKAIRLVTVDWNYFAQKNVYKNIGKPQCKKLYGCKLGFCDSPVAMFALVRMFPLFLAAIGFLAIAIKLLIKLAQVFLGTHY